MSIATYEKFSCKKMMMMVQRQIFEILFSLQFNKRIYQNSIIMGCKKSLTKRYYSWNNMQNLFTQKLAENVIEEVNNT